jgi:ribosomal protein L34
LKIILRLRKLDEPIPVPDQADLYAEKATNSLEIPHRTMNLLEEVHIEMTKRPYQPSVLKRKRKNGFLHRIKDVNGRKILEDRAAVGRHRLVHVSAENPMPVLTYKHEATHFRSLEDIKKKVNHVQWKQLEAQAQADLEAEDNPPRV